MSQECTTEDCANQTHTYLCGRCISDLQAWIEKIPVLIETLSVTIAKLDNVRPAGGGGGGGGHKPGSAAPINLDALQLQENLRSVWPSAKDYAADQYAAGMAELIQEWVTKSESLVSGPDEQFAYGTCGVGGCTATLVSHPGAGLVTCRLCGHQHDIAGRREEQYSEARGYPLPPREALDYLRTTTKVAVKVADFKNWVKLGHLSYVLDRVTTDEKPRRIYYPGDIFRVAQRMRDRRIKI